MYKIGELSKRFNLSRSTLLYYDSIDILKSSSRTQANYRLYTDDDFDRLERICMYRDMGIELDDIKTLLDDKSENIEILETALVRMERNIEKIRHKQKKIMGVIKKNTDNHLTGREIFTSVLRTLGFTEDDMKKFHAEYEVNDEAGHTAFLEFLGLTNKEIEEVKEHIK
ncbi:MerR family transcriptional regulator [Chengkuizengella sediminis]|uniref:MerR family transcriptional regulator n=1 Tax=Chengkuizengella sediminis TaxID=1885917 RepID=UPI001389FAD5|nr:MerR family transcriptional regulator [Chengkuizengella sediminis]NDI34816.1 MerR family transcriptional regulator [Chengkuizengella sediminis]